MSAPSLSPPANGPQQDTSNTGPNGTNPATPPPAQSPTNQRVQAAGAAAIPTLTPPKTYGGQKFVAVVILIGGVTGIVSGAVLSQPILLVAGTICALVGIILLIKANKAAAKAAAAHAAAVQAQAAATLAARNAAEQETRAREAREASERARAAAAAAAAAALTKEEENANQTNASEAEKSAKQVNAVAGSPAASSPPNTPPASQEGELTPTQRASENAGVSLSSPNPTSNVPHSRRPLNLRVNTGQDPQKNEGEPRTTPTPVGTNPSFGLPPRGPSALTRRKSESSAFDPSITKTEGSNSFSFKLKATSSSTPKSSSPSSNDLALIARNSLKPTERSLTATPSDAPSPNSVANPALKPRDNVNVESGSIASTSASEDIEVPVQIVNPHPPKVGQGQLRRNSKTPLNSEASLSRGQTPEPQYTSVHSPSSSASIQVKYNTGDTSTATTSPSKLARSNSAPSISASNSSLFDVFKKPSDPTHTKHRSRDDIKKEISDLNRSSKGSSVAANYLAAANPNSNPKPKSEAKE